MKLLNVIVSRQIKKFIPSIFLLSPEKNILNPHFQTSRKPTIDYNCLRRRLVFKR